MLSRIDRAEAADGVVLTSRLSRIECRVKHLRARDQVALASIDRVLAAGNLLLADVDSDVIEKAAEVRAHSRLKTPDAIHIATALLGKAEAFVTGDKPLSEYRSPLLQMIAIPRPAP